MSYRVKQCDRLKDTELQSANCDEQVTIVFPGRVLLATALCMFKHGLMSRHKILASLCAGIAMALLAALTGFGAEPAAQLQTMDTPAQNTAAPDAAQRDMSAGYPPQRLSLLTKASDMIGTVVWDRMGHKLGRIEDFVVDWNSGRVYCALVWPQNLYGSSNYFVAVPAKCFLAADGSRAVVDTNLTTLIGLPRFIYSGWDTAGVSQSLADAYRRFGQPVFWNEKTGLAGVGRFGSLQGAEVNNRANVNIGDLADLVIDLPAERVMFAVISFYGEDQNQHAVPLAALGVAHDHQNLVLNVDDSQVGALVNPDEFLGAELSDPLWVAGEYRAYGQSPGFDEKAAEKQANALANLENPPLAAARPDLVEIDSRMRLAVITAIVQADVANAALVPQMEISANNGVVTLTGRVDTETKKNELGKIAEGVAGAGNVRNKLEVK
jgi:sporulation protein YlmC with PRC-barrel domain